MRITFTRPALRDIGQIGEYLMQHNASAGEGFADSVAELFWRRELLPDSGQQETRPNTRVAVVPGFPCLVFDRRLVPDEIRIMRVRHAKRRPLTS